MTIIILISPSVTCLEYFCAIIYYHFIDARFVDIDETAMRFGMAVFWSESLVLCCVLSFQTLRVMKCFPGIYLSSRM